MQQDQRKIHNKAGYNNREQFRDNFLTKMATDIAWLFTDHKVEDDYGRD